MEKSSNSPVLKDQISQNIRKTIQKTQKPDFSARKHIFPLLNSLGSQQKILDYLPFNHQVSISNIN